MVVKILRNVSNPGASNLLFMKLPNSLNLSITFPRTSTILFITLAKIFVSVTDLATPLIQSPSDPVTPSIPPPKPVNLPIRFAMPPTTAFTAVTPILIIENRPLKVDLSLAD